jgi:hypothetical protein
MDGSRPSTPVADQPLLPLHATQRPPSRAESRFPETVISHYQTPEPPLGNADQEADIADSGAQLNEKPERTPPTRHNQDEAKVASVDDEAQALDWIVPVQNGMPPEKSVRHNPSSWSCKS